MYMTPEYLAAEEKEIIGCTNYAKGGFGRVRYAVITSFCKNYSQILSIGSAGYEPVLTGATHALDVHPIAEKFLRKYGWEGAFFLGDCRELPWPDGAFECGCLVEVVEHLPTGHDVIIAVKELNRVCRNWILSTPRIWEHQPEHKRVLTEEDIRFFCRKTGAKYRPHRNWWYMWRGKRDPHF